MERLQESVSRATSTVSSSGADVLGLGGALSGLLAVWSVVVFRGSLSRGAASLRRGVVAPTGSVQQSGGDPSWGIRVDAQSQPDVVR